MKSARNAQISFFLFATTLAILVLGCNTLTRWALPQPEGQPYSPAKADALASQTPPPEPQEPDTPPDIPRHPFPIDPSHERLSPESLPSVPFGPPGDSPQEPDRPRLSGTPQTLATEHFRIHYTLTGSDAVPPNDENHNQHPDYVEEVAKALEYVWDAQVNHFGWGAPPADGGLGGDDRYDVYLENMMDEDGTSGYSEGGYPDTIVGDNPNTPAIEINASHSFLALENDFSESLDWEYENLTTIELMQITAAHEFNHAVQFGYDGNEPLDWLWEATATWMEDEVFNQVNGANEELNAVFKATDTCQLAYGGETRLEDDGHWYGLWIFLRFLSERYGHQAVRALWEAASTADGYTVFDTALADLGISLDEVFRAYSLALLTRDFEEGANYPTVRLEGIAQSGQLFTPLDGAGQLGADYIQIEATGVVTVKLNAKGLDGVIVGIKDEQSHSFAMQNKQISIDGSLFSDLYLIVLNPNRAGSEGACAFSNYTVSVDPTGQAQAASLVLPAPNFIPPVVEGLLDPKEP